MQQSVSKIREKIFNKDNFNFDEVALELFAFQYTYNPVYRQFVDLLKINTSNVQSVSEIPFLPIDFFKTHDVIVSNAHVQKKFESSGTTGQQRSRHLVSDINLYQRSFETCFKDFYGDPAEWTILALLPSYLERNSSSLVFMVDELIKKTNSADSGFYLDNLQAFKKKLDGLKNTGKKILLIGVTFALLEFAEKFSPDLQNVTVMETGGMKGRREEMTRDEVHSILKKSFNVEKIHSEYGMTELLSQAYSKGNGIFETPPWMKILKRDVYDPRKITESTGRGALNVIDLANIYSCPFIATQDMTNILDDHRFEVTGRLDDSDVRGCNLMVSGV